MLDNTFMHKAFAALGEHMGQIDLTREIVNAWSTAR